MRPRFRLLLPASAFLLSGLAALVYQVVWQRVLALHTGVGVYSVAIIVAAFMAGLGIGSHVAGSASLRLSPRRALVAFASLEIGIALFGAVCLPVYYDILYLRLGFLYTLPWLAGVLQFAALLPPTLLMGMSLPFLVRATVVDEKTAGRTIGLLYGVNTIGAGLGAILAPWVLIRFLGFFGATLVAAGANALAGGLALLAPRLLEAPESAAPDGAGAPSGTSAHSHPFWLWVFLYGISGLCALSLEIVWFRLLDISTRSTAFTFGTLLAIYLFGSGSGCIAESLLVRRVRNPLRFFLTCQCVLLAYSGLAVAALAWLPRDTPGIAALYEYSRGGTVFVLGSTWDASRILGLYVLLPLALFGLPTVLMGASFPALQRAVQTDPARSGRRVGVLQAANILGCVVGSLLVGLLGLSWIGTAGSLRVVVLLGLVFAAVGLVAFGVRSVFPALCVLLAVAAALVPSNERLWLRLHGGEGTDALVAEDATSVSAILPSPPGRIVAVNGKMHSRIPFGGMHTRLGAVPALVHPAPLDVAIIGLGSGDTAWAAACRRETRSLTVFEIAGQQRPLLARAATREALPDLRALLGDPRLEVRIADGRHALAHGGSRYDLIEADALWPYAAYSGNLYSVEFFQECAARLKPQGLMCTWTPTKRTRAAFALAFAHIVAPRNHTFLIGSNEPIAVDLEAWMRRAQDGDVVRYLGPANSAEILAATSKLRGYSEPGIENEAPNRDLYPRDEFSAP